MDARRTFPAPAEIETKVRTLSHDLQRARLDFAAGRLPPERFTALSEALEGRLRALEAEVHARILERVRSGGSAGFAGKPGWGRRGST